MERRVAAVLAADMVGYSRLVEQDEVGTLQRQKRHLKELIEPTIAVKHGRIVKLTGDGLIAEFSSVVEAVQCAVSVQTEMAARESDFPEDKKIAYRVAVHLGDVVFDDGDVYGDGVNIAARLEALAVPGGVVVSGTAYDVLKSTVDVSYKPLGERRLKNIATPVRVYQVIEGRPAVPVRRMRGRLAWVAAAVAASAMIVGLLRWIQAPDLPSLHRQELTQAQPNIPSIAVLPFENLSGDPEQEYFADGITEDLLTDMSKLSGLRVTARNPTFEYKAHTMAIADIARELGVRYVLEGSVRRSGDQVRINAKLIDVETDGHLWAERYDGALANVFALQDEVTRKIVSALSVTLTAQEEESLNEAYQVNPEAYDLYLKGQSRVNAYSPQSNVEARDFFERAIRLDPSFGRAHAGLALSYAADATFGWSGDTAKSQELAINYARKALALNSTSPQVYLTLAQVYGSQRNIDAGIEELRRAIALDPNFADSYVLLGMFLSYSGKPEEGINAIQKAMELSPQHGYIYPYGLAIAYFVKEEYDRAIPILEEVLARNNNFQQGRLLYISILGLENRIDDAEWEAEEVLSALPEFSIAEEERRVRFVRSEDRARYVEGLRNAGLPE
ncbi:tetratricopeptide repeat protein [Ruegeria pomeroyi]|uniref:Tetratricopeptide repeat protein n=1 Tax=Ruegeria pomeroyi TaxID=89184 RepID=A0A9Q3WLA3_9RHOB|nr:adenylate/guanylate cyclase domain-containing protein [Ruegeria pomeroyi]MCE8538166.1 tetratricopeptide repeat protein [Ruegeria pomeroyi]